jgi:hypothetical protein
MYDYGQSLPILIFNSLNQILVFKNLELYPDRNRNWNRILIQIWWIWICIFDRNTELAWLVQCLDITCISELRLDCRFKFFSFYDLNPKEDPVRINLIYEQVRCSILSYNI